jgi:hypothetical protein
MTASVYGNIEFSEKIDAFARYDFLWGIWEGFAVARVLPNDSYIKGGTFQPNYGIKLDDHTAYTRGGDMGLLFTGNPRRQPGLIYDPLYVETGAELGVFISDFMLFTASVGNPNFRPFLTDPTYTTSLQIYPTLGDFGSLLLGASFANFKQQDFLAGRVDNVMMFGGFAGIGISNFTLSAEYDMINDFIGLDVKSSALMVEASYRIMKGLDAIIRYDRFDYNLDVTSDELSRIVIGAEFFPYSFIEIRPQYRIQMENPSISNNAMVVQFHLYY